MASSLDRGPARQDLASLRIDRTSTPAPQKRTPIWVGAGALALLLIGSLLWLFTGRTPTVQVAYAQRSASSSASAAEILTGSGYIVTADRYISLGVRVPSRIVAYLVEEGQRVEAGQALVQLDARQYEAGLAESRAALARARADVELFIRELARTRELHERNVASDADLDIKDNQLRVARTEVMRLEAQVARQELDLEDTVIRAPTSGLILEKFKEVGEIAVPGGFQGSGELIRMANLDHLRAELDINEADLSRITQGQEARVVPEAYPDKSYAARVVKLYPQINRQKGTLKVEVEILQPDAALRPDMSVRVAFLAPAATPESDEDGGAVLAPSAAVRSEAGESFAWVVTDGTLRRQPIRVAGTGQDGRSIVTQGLSGGEALVIAADRELQDGAQVIVEP